MTCAPAGSEVMVMVTGSSLGAGACTTTAGAGCAAGWASGVLGRNISQPPPANPSVTTAAITAIIGVRLRGGETLVTSPDAPESVVGRLPASGDGGATDCRSALGPRTVGAEAPSTMVP